MVHVCKAHRLSYHSTLRFESNKEEKKTRYTPAVRSARGWGVHAGAGTRARAGLRVWGVAACCTLVRSVTDLEATQGQMDGFFSQLPYKCHLEEVASVGD